jgi:hypothetical protein
MAPAVAHALKLPGKVRLPKELLASVNLPRLSPLRSCLVHSAWHRGFLARTRCVARSSRHAAVYGIAIRPINKFWLHGKTLSAAGSRFFSFDPTSRKHDRSRQPYDWSRLRDRWELSHLVRAVLALVSLVLVAAVNT